MKKIKYENNFIFGLVALFSVFNACSQWSSEILLTDFPISIPSFTEHTPKWIAASGSKVHAVWADQRAFNLQSKIYYTRSTDGGVTWGANVLLSDNLDSSSRHPSIAVSGSDVHIVWTDFRDGNLEIYHKRSADDGLTWSSGTRLSNNASFSGNPSVAVSGLNVHAAWEDYRDLDFELYYKRSTDGGQTWGTETRLTNANQYSGAPSVASDGSYVHVVWVDHRTGNPEIFYKRSTDNGLSWGADVQLTNNPFSSESPCISTCGAQIHVVWVDERDGVNSKEIYYKRSTDNGLTWSADKRITNDSNAISLLPSLAVDASHVHVVYTDLRPEIGGVYNIHYLHSSDGGVNWNPYTQLTTHNATNYGARYPSVAISDSSIQVAWQDVRFYNTIGWETEIYHRRKSAIQTPCSATTGLYQLNSGDSRKIELNQNYPNPVDQNTTFSFFLPFAGEVTLKVFDLFGKEIATLLSEHLISGDYHVNWNVNGLQRGVYFYKLQVNNTYEIKKLIIN